MKPDCSKCPAPQVCCSQRVFVLPFEARKLGLPRGTKYLTQRGQTCMYFDNKTKGCGIYSNRPLSCREFNCCNPKQVYTKPGQKPPTLIPDIWIRAELKKRVK